MYFRLASQLAIREGASVLKSKDAKHASQNAEYEDSKDDVNGLNVFIKQPDANESSGKGQQIREDLIEDRLQRGFRTAKRKR